MDSDLDVGRHCKQCNLKDFLPIFCQYCQQNFCRTHIFEHSGCNSRSISTPVAKSSGESLSCAFCSQSSILTCTNCLKFVCPSHRFHDGCNPPIVQSASPTATEKNLAAHALLAKHFPPKPNPPVVVMKKSQDPRIQLMKMRHKAIPLVPKDLSTASTERIHFTVICGSQEKIFWCRKVRFLSIFR